MCSIWLFEIYSCSSCDNNWMSSAIIWNRLSLSINDLMFVFFKPVKFKSEMEFDERVSMTRLGKEKSVNSVSSLFARFNVSSEGDRILGRWESWFPCNDRVLSTGRVNSSSGTVCREFVERIQVYSWVNFCRDSEATWARLLFPRDKYSYNGKLCENPTGSSEIALPKSDRWVTSLTCLNSGSEVIALFEQ